MKHLLVMILSALSVCGVSAQQKKVLVAYFSCTGTTETVARIIAESVNAGIYTIAPKVAYTEADLDWRNKSSRSSVEMKDEASRPALDNLKADIASYDVIFVGYPIWWNRCPTIINTFFEAYDFKGKTVIPFATSGGNSIANSERLLQQTYKNGIIWQSGALLNGNKKQIESWAADCLK